MRADRLLSILLLLQVHHRLTSRELAQRLEVSERTIHRDMEALGMTGIPVVAERGYGGGWGLLEEYRTNLTGLNEAEIQSLFFVKPDRLLNDLGLRKASEGALIKLLAALPEAHRRDAEYARQRIYIDTAGWHANQESIPHLATVQAAVWQEKKLRISYQRHDGVVERIVDPLGLVAKGTIWYLVAGVEDQLRTYRVSRIEAVEQLEEPCARPSDFDLASYWHQSSASFKANLPRYWVRVRMTEAMLQWLASIGRPPKIESQGEVDAEGRIELILRFELFEEARGYILSVEPGIEILEPLELRQEIIDQAQRVLAFYTDQAPALPEAASTVE
ncbi:helix-turn-helix transcriptional regulator [Ktedonospora formicarum]|uniref:Transcriptional regulator n=1 Tax=Ktedonospora formicarum TaxID=2778364 RepID=A0A8J3MQB4_9CHLR|nr:WYL domain-containing protein [Ktedonospora formicarum]GHO42448.1 transcriptional regulator [Ktedonospora formicarum]